MLLLVIMIMTTLSKIMSLVSIRNAVRAQTCGNLGSESFLRKGVPTSLGGGGNSGHGGEESMFKKLPGDHEFGVGNVHGVVSKLSHPSMPGSRPAVEVGSPGKRETEVGMKPWPEREDLLL